MQKQCAVCKAIDAAVLWVINLAQAALEKVKGWLTPAEGIPA